MLCLAGCVSMVAKLAIKLYITMNMHTLSVYVYMYMYMSVYIYILMHVYILFRKYIYFCANISADPLAAGGARQRRNCQQQGTARGKTRLQAARAKKQEARRRRCFELWQPCVSKLGGGQIFQLWQPCVSQFGGGQIFELWQLCVSKLGGGQKKKTASYLSVQKATLGSAGRCTKVCSVLHCHAF